MRRTVLLEPVLGKVANLATEMPHSPPMRPLRFIYEWLLTWVSKLRWFGVEDEISFQGVEYDEKTGKVKLKP
jgi:hypothetical protein